ncbi:MAG: histidine phosphatase family protein [Acidobacteriota bacterium]|nr:histidine phosphatase family protein [Acidobacteriota bacterium]
MSIASRTTPFLLILVTASLGTFAASPVSGEEPTIVYLVRHAERMSPAPADAPQDPPLTETGWRRATRLAEVLQDAGVERILSSDLRRTRSTATPLAERLGLEIELYDPGRLEELAVRLGQSGQVILVSGHSNTTPELVRLLGGNPGRPIHEATEFDRLYAVILEPGRPALTLFHHYGTPAVLAVSH